MKRQGGMSLSVNPNDLALLAVMRRYFLVKDEVNVLKARLEAARKDVAEEISHFYDPRTNAIHAEDILAWHKLRKEMDELMSLAAIWGRGGNIETQQLALESSAEPAAANIPSFSIPGRHWIEVKGDHFIGSRQTGRLRSRGALR